MGELEKVGQPLQHAVLLDASEDDLFQRCAGRLRHEATGRQYHERFRPPAKAGVDDYTGEALSRPPYGGAEQLSKDIARYREDGELLRRFYDQEGLGISPARVGAGLEEVTTA